MKNSFFYKGGGAAKSKMNKDMAEVHILLSLPRWGKENQSKKRGKKGKRKERKGKEKEREEKRKLGKGSKKEGRDKKG